jgi:hypothetical protein
MATRLSALGALVISATAALAAPAWAQHRPDRRGHEEFRTPHIVFDNRHHHGHYYPAPGYAVAALPAGYVTLRFGNRRLFFHGGVWYQPAGPRFVVVTPPVGVVVPVLPPAYATVWMGSVPYYYANEVYYTPAPGGYAVVAPPAQPVIATAPQPPAPAPAPNAAPQSPAGVWYYCESAQAYYPYVGQCPEPWRHVPASPPQQR